MGKEYKTLINKALERFYFRLSASGTHAERAARDSLTRATPDSSQATCHIIFF